MQRNPRRVVLALLALAASACGSSSSSGTGRMSVHLVDAPGDFQELDLDVQRVEIFSGGTGWVTLGTPNKVVNVVGLVNGVAETLADGASLPAGSYGQMRLVLGSRNSVVDSTGTHALKVPSGQQSGVKLDVSFTVQPGTTKDVFIDFDAHRSVFVHEAGASGQYILRPVMRAYDKVVTGAVQGTLTDATTHAGIAGAAVMAETLGGPGGSTVIRTVQTAADGSYTIDLLPVGATYYVVSQPVAGTTSYAAQASAAIALTAAAPVQPWSAAFTVASTGSVSGDLTPVATGDEADLVIATQPLTAGPEVQTLTVRFVTPAVATTETWSLDLLPVGAYGFVPMRRSVDTSGNETIVAGTPVNATVASGPATTVHLAIP